MTLPSVDTLATFGGALVDYAPIEDPTTDRSASGANQAYANAAMATHTQPRAWARVKTIGGSASLIDNDAVWGTSTPPTVSGGGTGIYTLTWPTSVNDELGVSHPVSFRMAYGNVGSTSPVTWNVIIVSSNVVSIYVWVNGVASAADVTFTVVAQ